VFQLLSSVENYVLKCNQLRVEIYVLTCMLIRYTYYIAKPNSIDTAAYIYVLNILVCSLLLYYTLYSIYFRYLVVINQEAIKK